MSDSQLPSDQKSHRRVLRVAFNATQEEQLRRFETKRGHLYTAREILIAAADIAGGFGDHETEKKLEKLSERAEASEVYPL